MLATLSHTRRRSLTGRDLISIKDLSREELLSLLASARELKREPDPTLLQGKFLGCCFHEASTRTRLSFEVAIERLGGRAISYAHSNETSSRKGESLHDTMKMMEAYCDLIVLRHPKEGAAQLAADAVSIPVINAGDGSREHPTQTLIDLFSIHECQGRLHELNVAMIGDLNHGRTVHSLALSAIHFGHRLYFVSPPNLEMPPEICRKLSESGIRFSMHRYIEEVIQKVDILYMTRIQKERFSAPEASSTNMEYYRLTPELLSKGRSNLRVLHPLPRVQEIDCACDTSPQAYYFQQAANGVCVRQALLASLL